MTSSHKEAADEAPGIIGTFISDSDWPRLKDTIKSCAIEGREEEIAFGLLTLVLYRDSIEIRFPSQPEADRFWPPPKVPTQFHHKGVPATATWSSGSEEPFRHDKIGRRKPTPRDLLGGLSELEQEATHLLMITISNDTAVYWWWTPGQLNYTIAPPLPD